MTINVASAGWVSSACTLPTAERPVRVAEFDEFFASSVHHIERAQPTRLDARLVADVEPVARDLAAREVGCCSFFTFTFETDATGVVMHIDVPAAYVDVLDALQARVGAAADPSPR
ncbi:hypothetical protein ABZ942_27895 [Nocardia sp. NPDC046473]|uniref:hypothetical protein n=1 Tax=Nocardia sp. NPDC046473 TaxID=3155733 RepID=UPI0033E74EAC